MDRTESDLEKSLKLLPDRKALREMDLDIPEQYKTLRTAEKAYEQLQAAGINVSEQLKERSYQTAELVCEILSLQVQELYKAIERRELDGDMDAIGALAQLQTGPYALRLKEVIERIVPDLTEQLVKYAKEHPEDCDLFPED